jgi:menaquinone-dependent protoporphyrinogen oxidase
LGGNPGQEIAMADALVVYASNHGHTAKIAARIATALRDRGVEARVHDVKDHETLKAAEYDAVIVGASVHAGHHQREIADWVRHRSTTLDGKPSAFFSVCLTAAEDSDESREATRTYVDEFLEDTGWTPRLTETFAGALQYREYDFATRLVMRLLMKRGHHPTDVTQDYDYTDWNAVERFGNSCADLVASSAPGATVTRVTR